MATAVMSMAAPWRTQKKGHPRKHTPTHFCKQCGKVAFYIVETNVRGHNDYYCEDHRDDAYAAQRKAWLGNTFLWKKDYSQEN